MSNKDQYYVEIQQETLATLERWDQTIQHLRNGFSQTQADNLYRCIQEVRNLSKAMKAQGIVNFLTSVSDIALGMKDRRTIISDEMLDIFNEIRTTLLGWYAQDDLDLESIDPAEESASYMEQLNNATVIRGFSRRVSHEAPIKTPEEKKLDRLLNTGKINKEQLEIAYRLKKRTIIEILVDEKFLSDDDAAS